MPYIHNPHHRSQGYAHLKSQWRISTQEESDCYENAVARNWIEADSYWGLHVRGVAPSILGVAPSNDSLYIAKFVCDQDNWHGYPVAHWLSPYDKPQIGVLTSWEQSGLINRAKKARIHRGKKCAL